MRRNQSKSINLYQDDILVGRNKADGTTLLYTIIRKAVTFMINKLRSDTLDLPEKISSVDIEKIQNISKELFLYHPFHIQIRSHKIKKDAIIPNRKDLYINLIYPIDFSLEGSQQLTLNDLLILSEAEVGYGNILEELPAIEILIYTEKVTSGLSKYYDYFNEKSDKIMKLYTQLDILKSKYL